MREAIRDRVYDERYKWHNPVRQWTMTIVLGKFEYWWIIILNSGLQIAYPILAKPAKII